MKHLVFEELLLMSVTEKAGARFRFHPKSTVISGNNGTGKSCLLKSLYMTLGAPPPNIHAGWKDANVVSSLRFFIDSKRYRMIRHYGQYLLFDSDDSLVGAYGSVTTELAPVIADLLDFHLTLSERSGVERQATPAFMFLPFYLDQDQGWTQKLESFEGRAQFSATKKDILDFHFGIRPSEYYKAKARLSEIDLALNGLRAERDVVQVVVNDIAGQISDGININIGAFKEEVERLLLQAQSLAQEEDALRIRMAESYSDLSSCRDQLKIAEHTLAEAKADTGFARKLDADVVRCPTCHAEYQNGFAEQFSIAADEDSILELIGDLRSRFASAERKYREVVDDTALVSARATEAQATLRITREQVALEDVLRGEGKREVLGILLGKMDVINERIGSLDGDEQACRASMKGYEDKGRRQSIQSYYARDIQRLLQRLGLQNETSSQYINPSGQINETGSALSRALLAFYFASIKTIYKFSTATACPLVIDSPRQQDQDDENWIRIRECIRDEVPSDAQLILAVSEDGNTDFGGTVIRLGRAGKLLDESQFADVADELRPLIEKVVLGGESH